MGIPGSLPKLSIVTPSLNQGAFIERTIRSVLDQGYPNLEYVIVDGGSSDETVEIIKKYEDQLAWWVSESDEGQTDAINKGIERTSGEIVAYINSDDYYLPEAFERAVAAFDGTDRRWIAGASLDQDDEGNPTEYGVIKPWPPNAWEGIPRGRHWWLLIPWCTPQPSTFWRRELFERYGPFRPDLHYAFDAEFMVRLVLAGEEPELLQDEELAVRVLHGDAKSADMSRWRPEIDRMLADYADSLTAKERRRAKLVTPLWRAGFYKLARPILGPRG